MEAKLWPSPHAMVRTGQVRRPGSSHRHRLQPQARSDDCCGSWMISQRHGVGASLMPPGPRNATPQAPCTTEIGRKSTANPTRSHHRMVPMETRASGRSPSRSPQIKNATVMLSRFLSVAQQMTCLDSLFSHHFSRKPGRPLFAMMLRLPSHRLTGCSRPIRIFFQRHRRQVAAAISHYRGRMTYSWLRWEWHPVRFVEIGSGRDCARIRPESNGAEGRHQARYGRRIFGP